MAAWNCTAKKKRNPGSDEMRGGLIDPTVDHL